MADEEPIKSPFQLRELSSITITAADIEKFVLSSGAKAGFISLFDDRVPCVHQIATGKCESFHDIKVFVYGIRPEMVEQVLENLKASYRGAIQNGLVNIKPKGDM